MGWQRKAIAKQALEYSLRAVEFPDYLIEPCHPGYSRGEQAPAQQGEA
ncbi:hypothetical protein GMLC_27850 [Geomonas limicola]|uniref:Uncharacterized protein n=1 Tax=Geomonas limicola TaxID=2740186 RepID=A0A6V8N9E2_9BACT|nr:hypothetical protein GMLC_27850 [Geomonas limicola]